MVLIEGLFTPCRHWEEALLFRRFYVKAINTIFLI